MKKVALLSMVLVLLLAAVGVGYAKWSAELQIEGDILTGSVDIGFVDAWCEEWPEAEGKDVGQCDVFVDQEGNLQISISNGYPCYGVDVYYVIANLGSIPVKVEAIELVYVSVGSVAIPVDLPLEVCTQYAIAIDEATGAVSIIANPTAAELEASDFDLHVTGEFGQIDPPGIGPGPEWVEGDLHVHVDQAAMQNTSYDFKIRIVASQWNEVQ